MTAEDQRNRAKEYDAKGLGGICAELRHAGTQKSTDLSLCYLVEIQGALEGAFFVVDFLL
jgi:hypothetical protein